LNKARLQFGILLLCCAGFSLRATAQSIPGWTLVWSDEFTQPDGSAPDSTKWGYEIGGGGWGNNELEYYTSRTNNARIESGQLVIEARAESYMTRNYTSARLLTKGKWSWTYGRIEARVKVPRGQGMWPAVWMLGANVEAAGWPTCGEIDIMENIGSEPSKVHGTVHGPGYSGVNGIGGPYTLAGELELIDRHELDVVVTKDSGGRLTEAKLDAARERRLPVVVVQRPARPDVEMVSAVADALAWAQHHVAAG